MVPVRRMNADLSGTHHDVFAAHFAPGWNWDIQSLAAEWAPYEVVINSVSPVSDPSESLPSYIE